MKQGKINLLLILCTIALISVGFSSWQISNDFHPNGQFVVDDIIDLSNIINMDERKTSMGISTFKLGNEGFISNGQITNEANLIYFFKINNVKFLEANLDNTNFSLRVELEQSPLTNFKLITSKYMESYIYLDTNDLGSYKEGYALNIDDDNHFCYAEFILADEKMGVSNFYFSLKFNFVISDMESYKNEIAAFSDEIAAGCRLKIFLGNAL